MARNCMSLAIRRRAAWRPTPGSTPFFSPSRAPFRRSILERLDGQALLVSELAAPFDISLQAVSRHIQVLVRAGLIQQERTGRISRCSLDAGPMLDAAVWMNRYSKYWQQQVDVLAATLAEIDERRMVPPRPASPRKRAEKRST